METQQKQPLLSPLLKWFMFAMVLANIAGTMYQMLLPLYLTELGANIVQVGTVFTLTSVVILVLQVFGGWISDSIGRLRAIAIGSIGGVLGMVFLLVAPTWEFMLVAMSVIQIPYALVGPSFSAFIAEQSTEENRGQVYGITDTIYQITGIVGPPLGGYLAGWYGFKGMLLVATIFYTTAAGLRIWMATTMRSQEKEAAEDLSFSSLKNSMRTMFTMLVGGGVITWIFITDGVRDVAFRLSGELQPIYLEQIAGISVQQIGILGSVFSLSMMFIPVLSGRISDRFGERVPISIGFLFICFAMVVFLNVKIFFGFIAVWVLFGIGVGLLSPAYQSLISKVVPQRMLGTFSGMFRSSIGLIALPAPYIGAQLWDSFSPRLPFIITAIAAFITIPPIWFYFKVPESQEKPHEMATE